MIRSNLFVTLFAVLGIVGMPPASAQDVFAQDEAASARQLRATYTDAELKSFADAVLEVHRINDAYIPKLEAADSRDEEQQLEQAALQEMVQAVENEGISVERYAQILGRVQSDRELLQRVRKELKDASKRTRI